MKRMIPTTAIFILAASIAGCTSPASTAPTEALIESPIDTQAASQDEDQSEVQETVTDTPEQTQADRSPLTITSSAFDPGAPIPNTFTCDGQDVTPELVWSEPPVGTQTFVLIMDDPDAPGGTWVHWVIFNIPAAARGLTEALPTSGQLDDGSLQGANSWGSIGYQGPCPPAGTHRYFFKLYAVDTVLNLDAGATKAQVLQAIESHILEQAEMFGTYSY